MGTEIVAETRVEIWRLGESTESSTPGFNLGIAHAMSGSQLYLGQKACQKGWGSGASSAGSSTAAAPAPTETAATATATTTAIILL